MTPEYYADLYKRYATYARNYPGAPLKKIASGANSDDYRWTEVLMKNIPRNQMWGMTLHYYTLPTGNWSGSKGSATAFNEQEYFKTMKNCLHMEELVQKHAAIMDKRLFQWTNDSRSRAIVRAFRAGPFGPERVILARRGVADVVPALIVRRDIFEFHAIFQKKLERRVGD